MSQSLAKDFNFRSLLKFAFPSIIMMIFMSLYSIVDGFFIAQYVDSMALSAANIVYPAVSILLAVGIMFGTGGSAVVAAKIGQEKQEEANRNFSALTLTTLIIGILGAVLGNLFCRQICSLLGATPVLMDYGTAYLRTILSFAPVCLLQALFQSFFVTAGRPGLGLSLTVSAGITNMLLDYLFVVPLHLGVAGAALATGLGQCIPAVAGILYFTFARKGLRFTRPEFSKGLLSTSCFNGSSEMVSNLSAAVVTYLFNMLMLKFEGEIGVAAITAILYGQFLFVALYLGYSIGVAPVFSFNYGSRNKQRLIRLYRISIRFVVVSSVIIALVAAFGSPVISAVFMQKGTYGFELTRHGGYLFSIAYLFCGTNIVASGIFTALSDGKTSALISFLRTFVFIVLSAASAARAWHQRCVAVDSGRRISDAVHLRAEAVPLFQGSESRNGDANKSQLILPTSLILKTPHRDPLFSQDPLCGVSLLLPLFPRAVPQCNRCPHLHVATAHAAHAGQQLFTLLTDGKPPLVFLLRRFIFRRNSCNIIIHILKKACLVHLTKQAFFTDPGISVHQTPPEPNLFSSQISSGFYGFPILRRYEAHCTPEW